MKKSGDVALMGNKMIHLIQFMEKDVTKKNETAPPAIAAAAKVVNVWKRILS